MAARNVSIVLVNRDLEEILISAERYACGRATYIVGFTCDYIETLFPYLSDHCLHVLENDLKTEFDMHERIGQTIGMQCDHSRWKIFYQKLVQEIDERKIANETTLN